MQARKQKSQFESPSLRFPVLEPAWESLVRPSWERNDPRGDILQCNSDRLEVLKMTEHQSLHLPCMQHWDSTYSCCVKSVHISTRKFSVLPNGKSRNCDCASFTGYKMCPIIRMPDANFLQREILNKKCCLQALVQSGVGIVVFGCW